MSVGVGADLGEYVCGGYFIVLPAKRAPSMNADLLPSTIVTTTDCIVDLVPNTWSIKWTGETPATRREAASKFALRKEDVAALTDWCALGLESGELGWPGVFLDLDVALRVKAKFLSRSAGLVVIGISLPNDLVPIFLEETHLEPGQGEPGVVAAIRSGKPPSVQGQLLGYDVLGWDFGGFHSYICNGLETEFAELPWDQAKPLRLLR